MDRLARRGWSRRELVDRLLPAADGNHALCQTVVDELEHEGLFRESDAASDYAASLARGGPAAPVFLLQKLEARGFPADLAERIVADVASRPSSERQSGGTCEDPVEVFLADDESRRGPIDPEDHAGQKRIRSLIGKLARRGYTPEELQSAFARRNIDIDPTI